ncbi:hypothetical protein LSH36_823g01001 [Paralvinella palmiformis]|uniref:non-specific serine/threonine protein kinase n=1 Tax=Paralvinella palmiformis TaxID=53620 RepID=A0AAD9MUP4_9ANNE|nr:hypothetical protein LSH36_823g01001 [Paralvinella palmiformis]
MDFGSMGPAMIEVKNLSDALKIQDFAAERCSMPYRAPELFNIESQCVITEKTDIWVKRKGALLSLNHSITHFGFETHQCNTGKRYSRELTELMLMMLKVKSTERPDTEQILRQIIIIENKADNRV